MIFGDDLIAFGGHVFGDDSTSDAVRHLLYLQHCEKGTGNN